MAHERFDSSLLAVLADAGCSIPAAQLAQRATDPRAAAKVDAWLHEAFDRGLVNVRCHANLPADWILTRKGRRTAKRVLGAPLSH